MLRTLPALAQQPSALGAYRIDVWTSENGLPGNGLVLWELVRSPDGYLWMRTPRGLTRFDGTTFVTFDANNTPAFAGSGAGQRPLLLDRRGRLWISTSTGLVWYQDGQFHQGPRSADVLIRMAEGGDGTLWGISPAGAVFRSVRDGSGDHMAPVAMAGFPAGVAEGVAADAAGAVWIPVDGAGVARVAVGASAPPKVRVFTTRDGLVSSVGSSVTEGHAGSVWVSGTAGMTRIGDGRFIRIPPLANGPPATVYGVAEEPDGTAWIATYGTGLFSYDLRSGRLTHFGRKEGLSDDHVLSVLVDPHGSVWAATPHGLNRIRPVAFHSVGGRTDALGAPPGCLVRDPQGELWLSTESGALFRGQSDDLSGRLDSIALPSGVHTYAMAAGRQHTLWLAREPGGVVRVDRTAVRRYTTPSGKALDRAVSVFEDSHGTLWIGSAAGVTRVRAGRDTTFTERDGLHGKFVQAFVEGRDGVVWVGGTDGLTRIAQDTLRAYHSAPGAGDSATLSGVLDMYRDSAGTIWVGTPNGITRISDGPSGPRFATIRTRQGLPDDWVNEVVADDVGNAWIVGLDAIARVPLAELNAVADRRKPALQEVVTFGREDGLLGGPGSKAGNCRRSVRGGDGRVWFSMPRGIATIDPGHIPRDTVAPQVHLHEALIDGVPAGRVADLTVPADARRLELRYGGVDLRAGPSLRFDYRLDGFDPDWVDAGTAQSVSYTSLPAGRYRFQVRARSVGGVLSVRTATLGLRVLPPFYRTWWFTAVAGSSLLALLWAARLARERAFRARVTAVADERTRLAREVHDTLAQGLAGIVMHLALAREKLGPVATAAAPQLDLVEQLARDALRTARQTITVLRPGTQPPEALDVGMRRVVAELQRESTARLVLTVTGTPRRGPPDVEFELLRIVQAALANAVGHADARTIRADVEFEPGGGTRVSVADDGRGFDPDAPHAGRFGLVGMSERAGRVGAVLTLVSAPGEGTEVVVRWSPRAS